MDMMTNTSLAIDNQLLETAFRMGGLKTPNETVNIALEEFIKKRKMEDLINMFHSIDYDSDYNYKEMRYRNE
jgi:Arc/MetJ family transcription regulator